MRVNKRIVLGLLLAISILSNSIILGQQPKRALTNDDVIGMVKDGLSDEVIVSTIQQFPANYDVSPDALRQMHRQGIKDVVLRAMQEAERVKNTKPTDITSSSESKTLQDIKPVIRHDFVFELNVCQSSGGDSVTCWFFITNKASERSLSITLDSHIDENLDGRSQATDVWIANKGREPSWGGFKNFASNTIKQDGRLAAGLKFQSVNPKATLIRVLRITCRLDGNDFPVDFVNVPITQKPQPSSTPKAEPLQEKQKDVKDGRPVRIIEEPIRILPKGTITMVSNGTPVYRFPFKYQIKRFSLDVRRRLDLCLGTITVGDNYFEINTDSGKSQLGSDCDSNTYRLTEDDIQKMKSTFDSHWYDWNPTIDHLYLRFIAAENNGKNKKKKEFYLYPTEALIKHGTRTPTLTGRVLVCPDCPAIVCPNCKEKLEEMKNLLDEFYGKEDKAKTNTLKPVRIIY